MTWIDPQTWYRQLPTVHVAALALITDGEGRVLLVKDAHRQRWDLPGGMAEDGEPPDRAAVREVKEEVGLDLDVERLLIVDWASPRGQRERPLLVFVFDGGTLRDPQVALQRSELDDWRYATIGELDALMPSGIASRIRRAMQAAASDTTTYLVNAAEPHPQPTRR